MVTAGTDETTDDGVTDDGDGDLEVDPKPL